MFLLLVLYDVLVLNFFHCSVPLNLQDTQHGAVLCNAVFQPALDLSHLFVEVASSLKRSLKRCPLLEHWQEVVLSSL